jgi:hypothetical protein
MWHTFSPAARRSRAWALAAGAVLGLAACESTGPVSPTPNVSPARASAPAADTAAATASADRAASAAVTSTPRLAYAWSQVPNNLTGSWAPPTYYSYNSGNGNIVIARTDPGRYKVHFWGLRRPPEGGAVTVLATAHTPDTPNVKCAVESFTDNEPEGYNRLVATVLCVDLTTKARTDSRFNILVVGNGALPERSAFALGGSHPLLPAQPLDPAFSWTSGPGTLAFATAAAPGSYDWRMGTGSPAGAIHLVNGLRENQVCNVSEYKSLGPTVKCFDHTSGGQPSLGYFTLLQASRGRPGMRFGFAWAEQQTRTTPYAPYPAYAYNSSGGAVQVRRFGVGSYGVYFAGLNPPIGYGQHETVLATAFGPNFASCSVSSWGLNFNPLGLVVGVRCSNAAGQPVDSRFNVMVME